MLVKLKVDGITFNKKKQQGQQQKRGNASEYEARLSEMHGKAASQLLGFMQILRSNSQ